MWRVYYESLQIMVQNTPGYFDFVVVIIILLIIKNSKHLTNRVYTLNAPNLNHCWDVCRSWAEQQCWEIIQCRGRTKGCGFYFSWSILLQVVKVFHNFNDRLLKLFMIMFINLYPYYWLLYWASFRSARSSSYFRKEWSLQGIIMTYSNTWENIKTVMDTHCSKY